MRAAVLEAPRIVALAAVAGVAACRSAPAASEEPGSASPGATSSAPEQADYVFVFLETGTAAESPTPDELNEIRAGHFANMERLAEERVLLLAGPMGASQDGVARQGLFVLDVDTLEEAAFYAGSDPAVQSGLLRYDARPWSATPALRRVLELDLQRPKDAPRGSGMRSYVLVTTPDADAAEPALAGLFESGAVLTYGRFGGAHEGGALFALDAGTFEEAEALLPAGPEWTLHEWYGTTTLERMGELE